MIGAAALLLMGLSATATEPPVLRQTVEPRWIAPARMRPIDVNYPYAPGQATVGGPRGDLALDPATTVFMQARKPKSETDGGAPKGLAKSGRAVSVGLALRW